MRADTPRTRSRTPFGFTLFPSPQECAFFFAASDQKPALGRSVYVPPRLGPSRVFRKLGALISAGKRASGIRSEKGAKLEGACGCTPACTGGVLKNQPGESTRLSIFMVCVIYVSHWRPPARTRRCAFHSNRNEPAGHRQGAAIESRSKRINVCSDFLITFPNPSRPREFIKSVRANFLNGMEIERGPGQLGPFPEKQLPFRDGSIARVLVAPAYRFFRPVCVRS